MSNKTSKIIVISDTHLTKRFNSTKYEYLLRIINQADQLIINGDLWDFWCTDFDGFVNSKWNKLFGLMLKKNTIYIHGNHDPASKCDDRVKLFSVKAVNNYVLDVDGQSILFSHGHDILKCKDNFVIKNYVMLLNLCDRYNLRLIFKLLSLTRHLIICLTGEKIIYNSKMLKNKNDKIKRVHCSGWLICGDTHCAEIDQNYNFANTGCIPKKTASYIIINNGDIKLIQENIKC